MGQGVHDWAMKRGQHSGVNTQHWDAQRPNTRLPRPAITIDFDTNYGGKTQTRKHLNLGGNNTKNCIPLKNHRCIPSAKPAAQK